MGNDIENFSFTITGINYIKIYFR